MQAGSELRELDAAGFREQLDVLLSIYASAMNASPLVLPGRRSIMQRHAEHASFHAITVLGGPPAPATATPAAPTAVTGEAPPPAAPPGTSSPGTSSPADVPERGSPVAAGSAGRQVIAFTYGFHGAPGQWWHDLVWNALAQDQGEDIADEWMADSFEVAEVHVHPDHQRQGIGRRMLLRLLTDRPERTALLSTMDADTMARRLYRRLGFVDLLTAFRFGGTEPPYAVMGTRLPLSSQPRVAASARTLPPPASPPAPDRGSDPPATA